MPRKRYWKKARNIKTLGRVQCNEEKTDCEASNVEPCDTRCPAPKDLNQLSNVFGSFHQGHSRFGVNKGKQCVANSCSSILYNKIKAISLWTTDDLDKILIAGDSLYTIVKPTIPHDQIYLLISELPEVVDLFGRTFSIAHGTAISGLVIGDIDPGIQCDVIMSLDNALRTVFSSYSACFVTFKNSTFAVQKRDQVFYVFDSHSRTPLGIQEDNGTSVLLTFTALEQLYEHIRRLAMSLNTGEYDQFEITGVHVRVLNDDLQEPFNRGQDDVIVEQTTQTSFSFSPLTLNDCMGLCERYGFHINRFEHFLALPSDVLGQPCKVQSITGDGNCFFRALSFAITGSEEYHRRIRLSTVKHLQENAEAFAAYLRTPNLSVEEYIQSSRMKYVGSWATEVEILAAADMLQVDIYTFSTTWLKYSKAQLQPSRKSSRTAIYLQHVNESHYEVMLCVKLQWGSSCCQNCKNGTFHVTALQEKKEDTLTESLKKRKQRGMEQKTASKRVCSGIHWNKEKHRLYMQERRRKNKESRLEYRVGYRTTEKYRKNKKISSKLKYAFDTSFKRELLLHYKHKYMGDEGFRRRVKQYYASNEVYREAVKTCSRKKYASDEVHQAHVKTYSRKKYASDEVHQAHVKTYSREKYASDEVHQAHVKTYSREKYVSDETHRENVKRYSQQKYASDEFHRQSVKRRCQVKYANSESHRQDKKRRTTKKRLKKKMDGKCINKVLHDFKKMIKEAPDCICAVCNRRFFRKQVLSCKPESYFKKGLIIGKLAEKCITTKFVHVCSHECHSPCSLKGSAYSKMWICFTCHRKLLAGKLPSEAAKNNLHLESIPEELICLNSLEQHLIAKHIPFAKVAALPKGGQKGVHGPVVCVPSNIDKTVSSLPRCQSDDQIIPVKLKRKLTYKGHYQYQFVNTARIQRALQYLKDNNMYYEDVVFDENWVNPLPNINGETNKEADDQDGEDIDKDIDKDDTLPDLDGEEYMDDLIDKSHTGDHGMYMDSCLQPVDIGQEILDQHFDKILCLAPAEGNDPIRILMDEENEAKSFPVLFPKGSPIFHDTRTERITISRYLNTRLMHADSRFARNTEYIFYSQYLSEVHQVLSSVSIALRKSHPEVQEAKLTPETLVNNDSLRKVLKSDSGYKFLKPIRGTPAFWQSSQKDLFAMVRQLGTPTWFCSFSAGDTRWPEIIEALLKEEGSVLSIDDLDWSAKCGLLRRNPVTAARMFERRFQALLKEVILSPANPIGKVCDYFYRVEFQQRGSPHTHCLFWVENAPQLDKDSDEDVADFIDQYVTCEIPKEDEELYDIVTTVQKHSQNHSKSCKKKGTKCRFNFPRPPTKHTYISRPTNVKVEISNAGKETPHIKPVEISRFEAERILKALWTALEDKDLTFGSIDDLFGTLNIDQKLFELAYDKLSRKSSVVLKRDVSDVWINQYNPTILKAWDANIDIQYVLDAYSCIVYIISYISKAEKEMGLLLEQARKETLKGNEDAKQAMKKLGGVYLQSREVSAQEAVYRVCNLHLKECSRMVQFIPVGDAVKMSLPLNILKRKSDGDGLDAKEMWMTSIIDRYKGRPDTAEFESMCLGTFCSEFRVLSKSEQPSGRKEKESNVLFKLQNGLGYVRRRTRTKPAVIRYPRFSQEKQAEKYYRTILQLFLPHRSDIQLKPRPFETYQNFYETAAVKFGSQEAEPVRDIVDRNMALFEKNADEIERAEQILESCGPMEDAWAQICPETEAERISSIDERVEERDEAPNDDDIPDLHDDKRDNVIEVNRNIIPRDQARDLLRSLNLQQSKVFYKIRHWCLQKSNGLEPEPCYIFISGGAGTGKSHLIKAIHYEANRILARILPNPDDTSVLLTAPTGVAAFNIDASTIHSTFSINVDAKLPYQPLGEDKVNSLRSKLESLQILIIDEISMVDHKLLTYIHGRLRQIKQCQGHFPFGKVSVIAVGDFYQLPPVKGKPLHSECVGVDLWSDNFQIVELTQIMRQSDQTFASTLNRLRTRRKKQNIDQQDINLLTQRETGAETDAIHIFAKNHQVDEHNADKLHSICTDVVSIEAEDFEKEAKSGKLQKRNSQFIKVFNTNLARRISLGLGARVLLTKNIDVSDGLVNGVFGTVSHIPAILDGKSMPSVVYVIFDQCKVGAKLRKREAIPVSLPANSTPIKPEEDRINTCGGMRRQFPLKLSFACTIHKLQGITLEKATVSFDKIFAAGQAYVALSRVKSLHGLVIQNFQESLIYCNEKVATALSSMKPFLSAVNTDETKQATECKLVLHNVQGLNSHLQDIDQDNRFRTADIICVTETWVSDDNGHEEPSLDGFVFYSKSRHACYDNSEKLFEDLKQQSHGGVGVFATNGLQVERLSLDLRNIEYLVLLITDWNILVAVIYRPLSYSLTTFRQKLDDLLQELEKRPCGCIVMGDFNENILRSTTVGNLMGQYGYEQHVTEPTTEYGTLIDHVYTRNIRNVDVRVIPTYYSYHEAVDIRLSV